MTKYRGYRGVFKRNSTGSTYVTVGQLLELGDIGSNRSLIDVTAHGDEWNDYLAGIQDGTELAVRFAYDPADGQQIAIKGDYDTGAIKKFHLENPDITPTTNAGVELNAIVTGFVYRSPIDGAYEAEATLKIVNPGVVAYTPT
jgi:hypothetical protein